MPLGKNRFEIDDSDPEPDLSPMIDCVFILLIFFIVTATFVEEDGLIMNRPEDSVSAQANDDQMLVLVIRKDSRIVHDGRVVSLDAVAGIVASQLQREERSPIIIQSHARSRNGVTIEVQNACLEGGAKPSKITLTDA
ncbi:MAG: biopolymer transport protein ExbD [Akkermansiaceae bacterium]|jgi:biopolymer transport protein ExbD